MLEPLHLITAGVACELPSNVFALPPKGLPSQLVHYQVSSLGDELDTGELEHV